MAKIRQELDIQGLEQANVIINNHLAQAGWLYDLIDNVDADHTKHHEAIDRHWEQLAVASKSTLINFSEKIVSSLKEEDSNIKNIIKSFFPNSLNQEFETLKHLNSYASTRNISNKHLVTGTVFRFTENNNPEYWVCLTPACDLVPSQNKSKWESRIGDNHLPFQAVKLIVSDETSGTVCKEISHNERLFINIDEEIITFKFRADKNASPTWETFYAVDHGKFEADDKFKLQRLRMMVGGINQRGRGKKKRAKQSKTEQTLRLTASLSVEAVVELRTEYALNLLQKFGANQTRVGLGFVNKLWN
jgi:hypothetical protein